MIDLKALHDAVLAEVRVNWADGALRFELRTGMIAGHERTCITAHGLSFLDCPRRYPWGPSESVNAVWAERVVGGALQLTVEMQSGDNIIAIVTDYVIE